MPSDLGIIDNRDIKFIDKFKSYCKHTKELKIASGYFYVSGFDLVKDDLKNISKIRVVMGNETDLDTAQQIESGYLEKVKEVLVNDLQKITGENGQKVDALRDLHDYIKDGKIEVKVYVSEKFHAKAYVFERKDDSIHDVAIVGSSNFSRAGMGAAGKEGNTELNSIHANPNDLAALKNWYEKIWNEAKPFEKDLLNIIETSQPYVQFVLGDKEYVTPFELFKALVFEFLNHDVTAFKEVLAEFQKIGVINAKQKINDFNGCIISDSVGLGKTLVGAGLIQDFQKEGKNVLLIIPASVKDNWERELTRTDRRRNRFFDIEMDEDRLKIITITELSRIDLADKKDRARIEALKNNYSVIVIDEAHRFRNSGDFKKGEKESLSYSGNKNYANLKELGTIDTKYVLLTATPLNNSINDLYNLITIFTNPMILKNKNSSLELGHFAEYGRLTRKMRELEKQSKIDAETKSKIQFELSWHLEGITRILEEVMILRTRTDISERYPDLIIDGKKISFKMAKINREKYEFPRTYLPIYEHITDFLANLHVPHIALINETAGVTLAGLYRMLLFKRLESSIYSFAKSLNGLRQKEQEFLKEIKRDGWDITRKRRKSNVNYNKEAIGADMELTEWLEEHGPQQQSPDEVTQEQVVKMIEDDLERIDTFYNRFIPQIKLEGEYSYDDPKLTKLEEILSKTPSQKVLIFTQYIDTVDYLYNNLKEYAETRNLRMDCVVGETIDEESEYGSDLPREKKIKLFSPVANGYKLDDDEREIDILISTDALAEGVNLQDCSTVVNYDLPWNPMRIVQRIGRVDRIGSTQRAIVYNIFPDKELDTLLELIEKLRTKIANITRIIGKESYILSDDDEEINPRVIGEKIKMLEQTTDYATYESVGRNPLLKGVRSAEERSAKILELKSLISRLKIDPSEFKEYDKVVYSITSSETKKGMFAMFRIFDVSRGEGIEGKMEDVILFKDFRTCDIQPVDVNELHLEDAHQGMRKSDSSIKYDLEKSLKEIESFFDKTIYQEKKAGFKKAKMRIRTKPTRLQKYVVTRLSRVAFNRQLSSRASDESRDKAKILLKEFKEKVLDQKASDTMKNHYSSSTSKDVSEVIQILEKKMTNEEFVRKTQNFYENYVRDNPFYSKLRYEKDVKYKMICWGALV